MSNRFPKSLLVLAVAAMLGTVPAAQARQGADDPIGHDTKAVVVTVAKKAKKANKVRHRNRHGRKAVRRADDNPKLRQGRGADDNLPRGNGADDAPNHG
jgi:hypothetical protein